MNNEHWHEEPDRDLVSVKPNRMGALNVALLFGTAAIALSLIVTPMLAPDKSAARLQASTMDYDNITTGSVPAKDGKTRHYTIRRSVLSTNPGDACIVGASDENGGC